MKIHMRFLSPDHLGPVCVARFMELSDPQEIEFMKRDAFERIRMLLDGLGFVECT
jgi:hypothetical protein